MKEPQSPLPSPATRTAADKVRSTGQRSRLEQIRSLTRLVIGGVEYGIDELLNHLEVWESEVGRDHPEFDPDSRPAALPSGEIIPGDDPADPLVAGTVLSLSDPNGELTENQLAQVRFALIGMIFDMQDRLSAQHTTLRRVENLAWNVLNPLTRPLRTSRLFSPVQKRFDSLVERGQLEYERWAERGRHEDAHSRALAKAAFTTTVDDYIDYLTTNPEVQELVQLQSTSLATEVVEEVRERTVSADTFLEGIARTLLKRVPRAFLPEPPPEVRGAAVHIQKSKMPPANAPQRANGSTKASQGVSGAILTSNKARTDGRQGDLE